MAPTPSGRKVGGDHPPLVLVLVLVLVLMIDPRPNDTITITSTSTRRTKSWLRRIEPWFGNSLMVHLEGDHKIEMSRRQGQKFRELRSL